MLIMNYDKTINIILLGERVTGKTTFFNLISKNKLYYEYTYTNGVNHYSYINNINDTNVKINLWDTGNISDKLLNEYISKINIAILFFNMHDNESQLKILKYLTNKKLENIKIYILGNIYKDKDIKMCDELIQNIYNFNIKVVTFNLFNNMYISNFVNDIVSEANLSKNYH